MATYDSIHTGEQVDNAVDIVLGNKSKGSATQPIYLDANGAAKNVNVDAAPTQNSQNLVQSGGVFTQLSTKYAKADVSTDDNLGTSNVLIPSQGAVKSYVDTHLAEKQDVVVAGDGIVKDGNTLSISTDNDFMTVGKLDNKWSHFVSGLDMGYGTETIEKMENAKRSTFDRSKFTVVGSPNITNDGIASGFSITKYVRTSNCDISVLLNHSWSVITPVLSGVTSNVYGTKIMQISAVGYGADGAFGFDGTSRNVAFTINTPSDTDPETRQNNRIRIFKQLNTIPDKLQMRADFNYSTGEYSFYYNIFDGNGWQLVGNETPVTTNKQLYDIVYNNNIQFAFNRRDNNNANTDVLDLKYTKITVDGVEVFSGNKTGIDTIKPDDYTVVGTPTISADGILTNYSNSNFLSKTQNINGNKITFKASIKIVDDIPTGTSNFIYRTAPATSQFRLDITNINGNYYFRNYATDGTSGQDGWVSPRDKALQKNVDYIVETTLDLVNSSQTMNVYTESGLYQTLTTALNNPLSNWSGITSIYISQSDACYVNIDLNSFKIYVDSNLVYQPCLKIPYTQTKDGKKIVDYNYKSRVEDEYGQAGFTPYYTLDTESRGNYTVVGSPTISSDFVASGFSGQYGGSGASYLTFPANTFRPSTKSWKVECKATLPSVIPNGCFFCLNFIAGANSGVLIKVNTDGSLNYQAFDTNNNLILSHSSNAGTVSANQTISIAIEFTGSQYKCYLDGTVLQTIDSTSTIYQSNTIDNAIGARVGAEQPFTGSIDLKEFKIYVDNKLAYQAVIPPNYTMATVKESAIVDSYDNGMNKWTKLANLTCKQQGSCTSGTAVTFTKPYVDTNYALSVPYTSGTKTKTGFTPSATGDWIANGKVDLNA
jgi:hypothetical protein